MENLILFFDVLKKKTIFNQLAEFSSVNLMISQYQKYYENILTF